MVTVYFEQKNYAEVVAYFNDEEVYNACVESLEKKALEYNFEIVTESVTEFDFDKIYDFTNDDKPKSTYFLFGSDWVREYDENGIEGVIKQYKEEDYLTDGASFEFIEGETSILDFANAMDGWNAYTTITEKEFNQLNK